MVSSSASPFMSTAMTRAPVLATACATAWPMPRPAPVTITPSPSSPAPRLQPSGRLLADVIAAS